MIVVPDLGAEPLDLSMHGGARSGVGGRGGGGALGHVGRGGRRLGGTDVRRTVAAIPAAARGGSVARSVAGSMDRSVARSVARPVGPRLIPSRPHPRGPVKTSPI